jgi:hypothetical protein
MCRPIKRGRSSISFANSFLPLPIKLVALDGTGGNERDLIPLGGELDPNVSTNETKGLSEFLRRAGADVTTHYFQASHELTMADVESAREWLNNIAMIKGSERRHYPSRRLARVVVLQSKIAQ